MMQIDAVDVVLVGPQGWNEDVKTTVAPLGDRARVLGFVSRPELAALYAGAEVFCFPSLLEGFGFPVLEAMAQGTPVVTSRGTSTEELAGDAAVLVDPRDPTSIASGVRSVLGDAGLAARLGVEGPKRAATFTWDETARRLAEIYRRVSA
jgi:glycosyltransferase involved in cell wall biosynthesis